MNIVNPKIAHPSIQHYFAEHNRVASSLAGADLPWLKTIRESALAHFGTLGFPTTKEENWKYTNVTPITKHKFNLAAVSEENLSSHQISHINLDSYRLVFINGHFIEALSQLNDLPENTIITSLAVAFKQYPALVEQYLGKTVSNLNNSFIALNTGFINDGACIVVPPNTTLNKSIELNFINNTEARLNFSPIRNLIVIGENAQAIVIENYTSANTQHAFTNVVTELLLGEQAHTEHYKLIKENNSAFHISTLQVQQQEKSCFIANSFACGGAIIRSDTDIQLAGEHTECTLNGLYLAHGKQHIDHHTYIDHAKPHCTSRENYKGIITEKARAVFNGKVMVQPGAYKTDAQQSNKNLLLSTDAEIDTKPELEIYADDVKCAHGATVGQLDESALFYLQSRGIPKEEAYKILVYAFAREIIEHIPLQPLRSEMQTSLNLFI